LDLKKLFAIDGLYFLSSEATLVMVGKKSVPHQQHARKDECQSSNIAYLKVYLLHHQLNGVTKAKHYWPGAQPKHDHKEKTIVKIWQNKAISKCQVGKPAGQEAIG
jgi:hypothetical protein